MVPYTIPTVPPAPGHQVGERFQRRLWAQGLPVASPQHFAHLPGEMRGIWQGNQPPIDILLVVEPYPSEKYWSSGMIIPNIWTHQDENMILTQIIGVDVLTRMQ